MQVLFLRNTIADGQAVQAGSIVELSDEEGAFLIRLGKATAELPKAKAPAKGKTNGAG